MTAYQLVARGPLGAINGSGKIHSKKIFRSLDEAREYSDEFKRNVTTPVDKFDMAYLEKVIFLTIVELELEDE